MPKVQALLLEFSLLEWYNSFYKFVKGVTVLVVQLATTIPDLSEEVVDIYIRRLERLLRLRERHEAELNPAGVRLMNRSIFEAYLVLRELGVEDRARQILQSYDRPKQENVA